MLGRTRPVLGSEVKWAKGGGLGLADRVREGVCGQVGVRGPCGRAFQAEVLL